MANDTNSQTSIHYSVAIPSIRSVQYTLTLEEAMAIRMSVQKADVEDKRVSITKIETTITKTEF